MQPEDEMDLVVTSAAVEADGAQATSVTETITPNPESGITNTAGIPPDMGLLSTAETTALPSHLGPQHDSIMAEAPIQEHLQEPSSAFTVGENTEQIESPNKTRAREDDEVNGSVNKRAKAAVDTTAPANNEPGHDVEPNGRIRPREDDEEGGSPASKRTKLEENEEGLSELKLSEGSDHAVVPVENGGQNLDTLAGQVTSPEAGASTIQYDAEPMTTPQQKALAEIIKNVKKVKDAKPFAKPVDYIALGIPTYPDIIKNPMDIETIEKRLKGSEYHSVADLVSDFDLMIQNCYTFNGSQHAVSISASNLQAYFKKALQKIPARDVPQVASAEKKAKRPSVGARQAPDAPRRPSRVSGGAARSPTVEKSNDAFALGPDGTPVIRRDSTLGDRPKREIHRPTKDLPYASAKPRRKKFQQELRFVDHIIAEMNKPKYNGLSWPFTAPVDPVALNIPTYFSIIKKPMDFGTISNKQKTNQYENAKDFKSDVDLMFDNCFRFNPASDNIHQMGKSYQEVFKRLWAEKDDWLAENAPTSSPQSPGMTPDSHDEDADVDEEGEEFDHREAELRQIHQQIQALHQRATDIYGKVPNQKAVVPKASSRKNSSKPMKSAGKAGRKSGSLSGPGTKAAPKPAKKPAKVKPLTQDEKAEIQEKVERLTDQHPEKAGDLVKIIKENDPKFAVSIYNISHHRVTTKHCRIWPKTRSNLSLKSLKLMLHACSSNTCANFTPWRKCTLLQMTTILLSLSVARQRTLRPRVAVRRTSR